MPENVYVLELSTDSGATSGGKETETLGPETDQYGRVIFRKFSQVSAVEVNAEVAKSSLCRVVDSVKSGIMAAGISAASVTIKLGFNSKAGFAFIGNAGVEASVEVKLEFNQQAK